MAEKTSGNLVRNIVIVVLVVAVFVGVMIFMRIQSRVSLYDDPNTTGNTSGNLLNGGRFCESGDSIYFANPYDDNSLYVMNSDLKKIKKLHSDSVSYLNVAGKYIFYTRRNDKKTSTGDELLSLSKTGLFRLEKTGKHLGKLYDDPTEAVCLYGNFVYYQHYDKEKGLQLNAAKIDGSSDEMLLDEGVFPYSVEDSTIYYTGYDNEHKIHSMDINGSNAKDIYDGNCFSLIKQGEHLYFLDLDRNYSLVRVNLDGSEPQTIVSGRIATYNVDEQESTVYYQIDDGENNGLYAIDLNGGSERKLAEGDYNYLHLVGGYLFYEKYDGSIVYAMDLATEREVDFDPPKGKEK
ncbi:MAG: DUF5050 domain-containing protein [Lachnospiraceae bacterium]|nr:DUF5050 domain-containing protein [Lachnospiraceae bacterium]